MIQMIYEAVKKLVTYGLNTGLIPEEEKIYTTNLILDVLDISDYEEPQEEYTSVDLEAVLSEMLDYAVENKLIEDSIVYKDLFDTRIMNCLMPRPSFVIRTFKENRISSKRRPVDLYCVERLRITEIRYWCIFVCRKTIAIFL